MAVRTMVFEKDISVAEKMARVLDVFGPYAVIEAEYENMEGDLLFAQVRF